MSLKNCDLSFNFGVLIIKWERPPRGVHQIESSRNESDTAFILAAKSSISSNYRGNIKLTDHLLQATNGLIITSTFRKWDLVKQGPWEAVPRVSRHVCILVGILVRITCRVRVLPAYVPTWSPTFVGSHRGFSSCTSVRAQWLAL